MEQLQAMIERHSVRKYKDRPIPVDIIKELQEEIDLCNVRGHLNIQLITNEPKAFDSMMAKYGHFEGVQNYIALIGKKEKDLDERAGYFGERIALKAQMLGLNTCFVAMTFKKGATKKVCSIGNGEKLVCVISLGYGVNKGIAHQSKPMSDLCVHEGDMPDWFKRGMECVMLAPTAMNQQKFKVELKDDKVIIQSTGGFYNKIDLGIVKYHFEIGSNI